VDHRSDCGGALFQHRNKEPPSGCVGDFHVCGISENRRANGDQHQEAVKGMHRRGVSGQSQLSQQPVVRCQVLRRQHCVLRQKPVHHADVLLVGGVPHVLGGDRAARHHEQGKHWFLAGVHVSLLKQ
jgi:hypothetical protein